MPLAYTELIRILNNPEQIISEGPDSFIKILEEASFHHKGSTNITVVKLMSLLESLTQVAKKLPQIPAETIKCAHDLITLLANQDDILFNQDWFIDRMSAIGYKIIPGGQCFGMSSMSMQAFLAGEIPQFDARLHLINSIPLEDFQDNFKNLRDKQKQYIENGRGDEAEKINKQIVDIMSFFDGIALHQNPASYKYLFENPHKISGQNFEKTIPMLTPVSLDSPKNRPTLVSSFVGAYSEFELEKYLLSLKRNLGSNNFTLGLESSVHAINLNYNAKTGRWLLIDPNHLPGKEYIHHDLLAKQLFLDFELTDTLILETSLFTTNENEKTVGIEFVAMQKTPAWEKLHDSSKINLVLPGQTSLLYSAIKQKDQSWISKMINLDVNQIVDSTSGNTGLIIASNYGLIEIVELLINNNALINKANINGWTPIMSAAVNGHRDVVEFLINNNADIDLINKENENALIVACKFKQWDIAHLLILKGCALSQSDKNGNTALSYACKANNTSLVESLLKSGAIPTQKALENAYHAENIEAMNALIAHGAKPTIELLHLACIDNKGDSIAALMKHGLMPSEKIIMMTCIAGNTEAIKAMIDHGVEPNRRLLAIGFISGQSDIITTMYDYGIKPTNEIIKLADFEGQPSLSKSTENKSKPLQERLLNACNDKKIDLIKVLLDQTIPNNAVFVEICDSGNLEISRLLANKIACDAVKRLEIANLLAQLSVPQEKINHTLEKIINDTTEGLTNENIAAYDTKEVYYALLTHLKETIFDKNSESGLVIQHHKNPILDKMFGIQPWRFKEFKKQYKEFFSKVNSDSCEAEFKKSSPG